MDLRSQLETLLKYGLSTSKYILRVKTITNHLGAVGDLILDPDLKIFIVEGLGSNFNYTQFVTSMNMSKHKPSVSALRGMLEIDDCMFSTQGRLHHN